MRKCFAKTKYSKIFTFDYETAVITSVINIKERDLIEVNKLARNNNFVANTTKTNCMFLKSTMDKA